MTNANKSFDKLNEGLTSFGSEESTGCIVEDVVSKASLTGGLFCQWSDTDKVATIECPKLVRSLSATFYVSSKHDNDNRQRDKRFA